MKSHKIQCRVRLSIFLADHWRDEIEPGCFRDYGGAAAKRRCDSQGTSFLRLCEEIEMR
jgi:hypothetical protein